MYFKSFHLDTHLKKRSTTEGKNGGVREEHFLKSRLQALAEVTVPREVLTVAMGI